MTQRNGTSPHDSVPDPAADQAPHSEGDRAATSSGEAASGSAERSAAAASTHDAGAATARKQPHVAAARRRQPARNKGARSKFPHDRMPRLSGNTYEPWARSLIPVPPGTDVLDRLVRANLAHLTGNLSPASVGLAYADWATHLATAPGKQFELAIQAWRKSTRLALYVSQLPVQTDGEPCIEPLPHDHRFDGPEWRRFPFDVIYQNFLLIQQWWWNASSAVHGVAPAHEKRVQFLQRQLLDTVSPANFPITNPRVLDRTVSEGGYNFVRGAENFMDDLRRQLTGELPAGAENFRPGRELATTPGRVVYRNRLIELIQYGPATETVYPEPVLVVPAWIMKYYILDLSPHNSLIGYLVQQGHTVFCISWHNPTAEDRDLSLEDYRRLGILAARKAVQAIVPDRSIHALGYCIGGTLLAIEAARMARDGEDAFGSLSFLATQVDFTEPGELELFIDESEVSYLEDVMWSRGYLETREMAGAFQMLRSADLIWSRGVQTYLLGEPEAMFDLKAWNADTTRMPYRMHSEYLRHLFLGNELAYGRYCVDERPVALPDIQVPIFAVATETDHIAPWRSVYKLHLLSDVEITFVLTRGGHNAGIISEPGHPRRSFRTAVTGPEDPYRDPDEWLAHAEDRDGSWWPSLHRWLARRSGRRTDPPPLSSAEAGYPALAEAPGTYVFER